MIWGHCALSIPSSTYGIFFSQRGSLALFMQEMCFLKIDILACTDNLRAVCFWTVHRTPF